MLYSFQGTPGDGANPYAGVMIGSGGVLYGTTQFGGTTSNGTVFKLTPPAGVLSGPRGAWTETLPHNFTGANGDGATPAAGVAIGKNGALYGTTQFGGTASNGTVFKLTP